MIRKAAIFDIDGTLSPEVSWTELTHRLGTSVEEHLRIFGKYRRGEISSSAYGEVRGMLTARTL
jgi:phosphoserine phosphatase